MIRKILFFTNLLLTFSSFAQKDKNQISVGMFYSDRSTISKTQSKYDLPSILNSSNQIEIRLFVRESWSVPKYIILVFNKTWTISEFDFDFKNEVYIKVFEKTDEQLAIDFQNLVDNNIFSLQAGNRAKYSYFDLKTNKIGLFGGFVTDGVSYNIEFKVGNDFRSYGFTNPEAFATFETTNKELKDFNSIVEIFMSEIKK